MRTLNVAMMTMALCMVLNLFGCSQAKADEETPKVKSEVVLQSTQSWNGDEMPAYLEGKPQCSILKITVPPHTRLAEHKHTMMNAGIIVKGELHVEDHNGKNITLRKGDPILECVNRWHYGENLTDEEVVLYVFYAGVEGEPLSVPKTME